MSAKNNNNFKPCFRGIVVFCLIALVVLGQTVSFSVCSSYAEGQVDLPEPGSMLTVSSSYIPPMLKGLKVYRNNPFRFDFILDKGDFVEPNDQLQIEASRLLKYFLASLTIPEEDLWVNLSPYEKDRIVPESFGQTEMGRDLLVQDYILKQVAASLIYPDGEVGEQFWQKVYAVAEKRYGTTEIPVDTFNKVWIVPEKATVFENEGSAYIVDSRLKVMLEEDYLAIEKNMATDELDISAMGEVGANVMRKIVIPVLEKEVNEGENFEQLRQIYHSLILAIWFKDKIKKNILAQAYVDQNKIAGVDIADKTAKERIWLQYVDAFKKGVYDYIKEDYDPATNEVVVRKYFSGGAGLGQIRDVYEVISDKACLSNALFGNSMIIQSRIFPTSKSLDDSEIPVELTSVQHTVDNTINDEVRRLLGGEFKVVCEDKKHTMRVQYVGHYYSGKEGLSLREQHIGRMARALKKGTPDITSEAAEEMKCFVSSDDILVPIPSSKGSREDNLLLANKIAALTGAKVRDILRKKRPTESQSILRHKGKQILSVEEQGVYSIDTSLDVDRVVFIDDIVASGETLSASFLAVGGGSALVYAKSDEFLYPNDETYKYPHLAAANNFVVTGGSGDIGAALVHYIHKQEKNQTVIFRDNGAIQRYVDRSGQQLPKSAIAVMDFFNTSKMTDIISSSQVFYHLSGVLDVPTEEVEKQKMEMIITNIFQTAKLIHIAERVNPDIRFVYPSTRPVMDIYERPDVNVWVKKAIDFIRSHQGAIDSIERKDELVQLSMAFLKQLPAPEGVRLYVLQKYLIERYLESSDLRNYIALRITSVFGPGAASQRNIKRLIEGRIFGKEMKQKDRVGTYIYIDDLVDILYKVGVIDAQKKISPLVACDKNIALRDVWSIIEKYTPDAKGRLEITRASAPKPVRDPKWTKVALNRSFTSFEEGLFNQIQWTKQKIVEQYISIADREALEANTYRQALMHYFELLEVIQNESNQGFDDLRVLIRQKIVVLVTQILTDRNQQLVTFCAITGAPGSGKTMTARYLRNKGYRVIDTDMGTNYLDNVFFKSEIKQQLIDIAGEEIISSANKINKVVTYKNEDIRRKYNAIMKPVILNYIFFQVGQAIASGEKIVFEDSAYFDRLELEAYVDVVWLIKKTDKERHAALLKRYIEEGKTPALAQQLIDIASQAFTDAEEYQSIPENHVFMIDNAGVIDELYEQIDVRMKGITSLAESNKGGIDLARTQMSVRRKGEGIEFSFDLSMIHALQNVSGLTPIIIDMYPMNTSVSTFLELQDAPIKAATAA